MLLREAGGCPSCTSSSSGDRLQVLQQPCRLPAQEGSSSAGTVFEGGRRAMQAAVGVDPACCMVLMTEVVLMAPEKQCVCAAVARRLTQCCALCSMRMVSQYCMAWLVDSSVQDGSGDAGLWGPHSCCCITHLCMAVVV
jgi:hypothetical protein